MTRERSTGPGEMDPERVRRALDLAAALVIAWERGRLAGGNEAYWPQLREALEQCGVLGWYGITIWQLAREEWELSG